MAHKPWLTVYLKQKKWFMLGVADLTFIQQVQQFVFLTSNLQPSELVCKSVNLTSSYSQQLIEQLGALKRRQELYLLHVSQN